MLSYLVYAGVWLMSFLPFRVLYFFSDLLYYVLYDLVHYRREVVRENLKNSFPEKSEEERVLIEKKFYRNLCDFFVEAYKTWNMSEEEIKKRCVFKHTEILQNYYDEGRNVIGVMGHYGNWEWMASYSLWIKGNVNFYTLYKPIHNRLIDRMMIRIRSRFGAKPVPKNDILRVIMRDRREGQRFMAAFIGDQTPNKDNLHFWMEFLNQDTPVLIGTEKIATKFNFPVISLYMKKKKRGYYEVDFVNLCENPADLAPGELTVMHTRLLEQQIREAPEHWLWSHRRWKRKRQVEENSEM